MAERGELADSHAEAARRVPACPGGVKNPNRLGEYCRRCVGAMPIPVAALGTGSFETCPAPLCKQTQRHHPGARRRERGRDRSPSSQPARPRPGGLPGSVRTTGSLEEGARRPGARGVCGSEPRRTRGDAAGDGILPARRPSVRPRRASSPVRGPGLRGRSRPDPSHPAGRPIGAFLRPRAGRRPADARDARAARGSARDLCPGILFLPLTSLSLGEGRDRCRVGGCARERRRDRRWHRRRRPRDGQERRAGSMTRGLREITHPGPARGCGGRAGSAIRPGETHRGGRAVGLEERIAPANAADRPMRGLARHRANSEHVLISGPRAPGRFAGARPPEK
jgi:hypothetical protein